VNPAETLINSDYDLALSFQVADDIGDQSKARVVSVTISTLDKERSRPEARVQELISAFGHLQCGDDMVSSAPPDEDTPDHTPSISAA
jgi:hypothetical protein